MNLSQVTTAFQPYYYTTREPILGKYKRFWHYSRSRWDPKKITIITSLPAKSSLLTVKEHYTRLSYGSIRRDKNQEER
jgi:hypothetical protein